MRQNLSMEQKIDISESCAININAPANTPDPVQQALQIAAQPASGSAASPQPAPADKSEIGMGGSDVAFAISSKLSTSSYSVHIGTYRNETDAHRAHYLPEQFDHSMRDSVFLNVKAQRRLTIIYYNLVPAALYKHHLTAVCTISCQQKK